MLHRLPTSWFPPPATTLEPPVTSGATNSPASPAHRRGPGVWGGPAAQLQRLQTQLTELRQRPPVQLDKASFRDLGPMVDQILELAEKQATAITSTTAERAAKRQAEAEQVLAEAREQAAKALRDFEAELAARRTAEDQVDEARRSAAEAELAGISEHAE